MSEQIHKFNENNVYRVRRNSRLNEGLFLSKLVLKKHGNFAQVLSKNGYATIQSIKEENVEREGRREINPKITLLLSKSANFEKLTEGIVLRDN